MLALTVTLTHNPVRVIAALAVLALYWLGYRIQSKAKQPWHRPFGAGLCIASMLVNIIIIFTQPD